MSDTKSWIRRSLMGSTTLPAGIAPNPVLPHAHKADGSCCGHHHHGHDHAHAHDHHDHVHDENCNH